MNVTIETFLFIALAIGIPLLGAIALALWHLITTIKLIQGTLSTFHGILQKAEKSLDHNRDEHTKMISLIETNEKAFNQRMDLLEERLKHEQQSHHINR